MSPIGTIQTLLKIKADARQAVSGLKPLQTTLEDTAKVAQTTEKSLNNLDGQHKIQVNDTEIDAARKEIDRLRNQIRKDLSVDINADTRDAQKRIGQLQKTVKTLDNQKAVVDVEVDSKDAESTLSSLSTTLKGAAKGVGLAALAKGAFDAAMGASSFETNMRSLNTVLGKTTQIDLQEWIEDNADALNLSEADLSDATRQLSLYGKAAEAAGGDSEKFIEDLIEVAANAAAFTGENPAEAVEAIGAAMRGEFDSLERFGINLTQDKINARGLKDGLMDATGVWVDGGKQVATYNAILEQSGPLMGSVERNADTLGGKISDLRQKSGDLATTLGEIVGPAVELLADGLVILADSLDTVLQKYQEVRAKAKEAREDDSTSPWDLLGIVSQSAWEFPVFAWNKAMEPWQDETKKTKKDVDDLNTSVAGLGPATAEAVGQSKEELDAWKKAVEEAEDAIKRTIEAFGDIGGNVRTKISFIINRDDLEEDIAKTIKGVKAVPAVLDKDGKTLQAAVEGIPPVDLPANLKVGDIKGLDDNEQELIGKIDSWVAEGLEEGARRAEIVPGFDEDAWFKKVRQGAKELLLDANIDPKNIERVLTTVFGLPRKVPTSADISGAKDDLDALYEPVKVPVYPEVRMPGGKPITPAMEAALTPVVPSTTPAITPSIQPPTVAAGATSIPDLIAPKSVPVTPAIGETQPTKDALNNVANPAGKPRRAMINPVVDGLGLAAVRAIFADLTKTETKTINVVTNRLPGGGAPGAPPQAGPQLAPLAGLLAVGTAMAAAPASPYYAPRPGGAVGGTEPTGTTTRLAPRQTPVQVLLDGAVIADHLDARRSMAAVESIRRTA